MKTFIKTMFFSALILLICSSGAPTSKICKEDNHVLMVLKDPMNNESFSVFQIKEVDGILVGTNIDEYHVNEGIYRIEASSNDKFYHKTIVIIE